jgi:hypothetical protein
MKIGQALPPKAAKPPTRAQKEAALEKELHEAWGTYMYCEAADFMSAEEKATSAAMRTKMSQLHRELADLRGDKVLSKKHMRAYLARLQENEPLAGLARADLLPFLSARSSGLSDEVAEVNDALIYKKITPEQLQRSLEKHLGEPTREAGDGEVRAWVAEILRRGVAQGGPDLFASPDELVSAVQSNPKADDLQKKMAELVTSGDLCVSAGDLSNWQWQAVYQEGDLGRWGDRLAQEGRQGLAERMLTMLNHPKLNFPAEERSQALGQVKEWLQKRLDSSSGYAREAVKREAAKWEAHGVVLEEWNLS